MLTRLLLRLALIGLAVYLYTTDTVQDTLTGARQELYTYSVALRNLSQGDLNIGGLR